MPVAPITALVMTLASATASMSGRDYHLADEWAARSEDVVG
jgi:hypothetical protein